MFNEGISTFQQRVDSTKYLEIPVGVSLPNYPIFIDGDTKVIGKPGSLLKCDNSGTAFVVGWNRLPIDKNHWTGAQGFRTTIGTENTYLRANGTPWDRGPKDGWNAVQHFVFELKATLNSGTWSNVPIGGIQGIAKFGYGPDPRPWLLWWDSQKLIFSIQTSDNIVRHFGINADINNPQLNLQIICDFNAGTVVANNLAGTDYTVDSSNAGANWGPGLRFIDNEYWPFSLGRIDAAVSSGGYWGGDGPWQDITFSFFVVTTASSVGSTSVRSDVGQGVIYPYDGAKYPLPLFRTKCDVISGGGPVWLYVAKKGQEQYFANGNITFDGVNIQGLFGNPAINIGSVTTLLKFDNCNIANGSRSISATQAFVDFPISINNCDFVSNSDYAFFLWRACNVNISNCTMRYPKKSVGVLVGCNYTKLSNIFIAPPTPGEEVIFEQNGGTVTYENVLADYEGSETPLAIVRLTPNSWDQPWFETGCRLIDCSSGIKSLTSDGHNPAKYTVEYVPQVYVNNRVSGYTGDVKIKVDTLFTQGNTVVGPGLSDPTIKVENQSSI